MRTALVLLALPSLGGLALADPPVPVAPPPVPAKPEAPAPAAKPAPPLTPEQAADAVLVAVKAKDDAALKALASKDDPDPWLVADELIRRGEHDGAEAFAKAAPRVDVEKLPEYVASRRGKVDDAGRRARVAAANSALAAGKPDEALAALGEQGPGPIEDVVGVRLAMGRGSALASLVRLEGAAASFLVAGATAERIGWLTLAARAFHESGASAYRRSAFAAAREAWQRRLSISERRGDKVGAAKTLGNIGVAYKSVGDYKLALSTYERALAAKESLGDKAGAALTLGNIGNVHQSLGEYARALEYQARALKMSEDLGDRAGVARIQVNMGNVHYLLGDHTKALSMYERALVAREALGDKAGTAEVLSNIGGVYHALGDYEKALVTLKRALVATEEQGDRAGAATTRTVIGNVYRSLGDYAQALSTYERALAEMESLGDKAGAAAALGSLGVVYFARGDYAKSLSIYERALAAKEALGDKAGAATTLGNLGSVYRGLGDYARALSTYQRALAAKEGLGDKAGAASTRGGMGNVYHFLGDYAKALAMYEDALAAKEALGDKAGAASMLGNIGLVYSSRGEYAKALSIYERALAVKESLGDKAGAASTLGNIGGVYQLIGDRAKALATYERALAAFEALGKRDGAAYTLSLLASVRFKLHDWPGAIDASRRGAALVPFLVSGLGDEQGAAAREQHTTLFSVGARAAAETHDMGGVSEFIERGRAGSFLESLGDRAALQSGLVPPVLAAEEAQARGREAVASQAYRRAIEGGDFKAIQARRHELGEAQAGVMSAVERIQREAKAAANVVHFQPDPLDVIRKRLSPDEALVLYGLFDEGPLALVVTPGGATTANLPGTKDIQAACEALLAVIDARAGPDVMVKAVDALHDLVVKPLGLSPETKRLLVSPDGVLSYVPLALLASDREIVYVPSGTTYGLLVEDGKDRGDGVLALGDPDYASKVDERATDIYTRGAVGKLERLPATADEARTVGATVLLGKAATEKGLREAVAKRTRWRSVHFACHGLINAERPGFSSLALTSDGDDDGFLTVLEVFRSKIPADLVVLSACETAKGKVVKGEGIMGLTRAFMFAGAPRVICSLWKVDDAATKALMVKFYELWNPKDPAKAMGTAAALKAAQEYIRTYETEVPDVDASQREGRAITKRVRPWEHPYYWAAWVLWGLPD